MITTLIITCTCRSLYTAHGPDLTAAGRLVATLRLHCFVTTINIGRHVLASDVQGLVSLFQSMVQLLLFREVILARDQCYLIKRIKILLD